MMVILPFRQQKVLDKDEKDKKTGKYIRKERYAGSMSRSFYIGEGITQDEISAKYENGILQLKIPKRQTKQLLVKIISQLKDNHSTSPLQRTSPLKGTCFLAKTIVRFETYFIFFHLLPFTAFYFR